jgi:hypothetical protein
MKTGKEVDIDLKENYNIKLGTIDNKNPKSIYLNITAWGDPISYDDEKNYVTIINRLRKKIKQNLYNNLDKERFYSNNYMVDLDMRHSGIRRNKRSFMSCEITLFQKKKLPVNNPELIDESKELVNKIINTCLEDNDNFVFYKTKS